MAQLDLRLRNLETGELLIASFESEQDVAAWLVDRPPFMEVLGLKTDIEDPTIHERLKAMVRPFDAAELEQLAAIEEREQQARTEMQQAELLRAKQEEEARRVALRAADPNRVMKVYWSQKGGVEHEDRADERAITDEAREAVLAWVAERNEWVADRGQIVAEAKVWVWPAKLPKPTSDRVQGGTFIPVTGPAKPAS